MIAGLAAACIARSLTPAIAAPVDSAIRLAALLSRSRELAMAARRAALYARVLNVTIAMTRISAKSTVFQLPTLKTGAVFAISGRAARNCGKTEVARLMLVRRPLEVCE